MEVDALASALCDSSSHINLLPHADQRPCKYHRQRAAAVLALLRKRSGTDEETVLKTAAPKGSRVRFSALPL